MPSKEQSATGPDAELGCAGRWRWTVKRCARPATGSTLSTCWVSSITPTGVVLAQIDVDEKTNEIPPFSKVLDQIPDITDVVITVDAMHAQTAHAEYLHNRGAHLLVTVKGNQPGLHAKLKALPWTEIPIGHTATGRGHGRIEKRTLKAVTVPAGLGFPHAAQAIQIIRTSRPISKDNKTKRHKRRPRRELVYAICTLTAQDAQPAELAAWAKGHWAIENRLHWVRDVTLGEDLHQARTGSGPQVMAALRNLVISLLRFAGHTNIARALRQHARHPHRAISLVTSATRQRNDPVADWVAAPPNRRWCSYSVA